MAKSVNRISGDADDNSILGTAGDDPIYGRGGDDTLYGNDGNDGLFGGVGNDVLYGSAGGDGLYGNNGDDTLFGGDSSDILSGNNGDDVLVGGAGGDKLSGGPGADKFIYLSAAEGQDRIGDFEHGTDKMDVSAIDAGVLSFGAAATTTVTAHTVNWYEAGGMTIVEADVNGDTVADFHLDLTGTGLSLTARDFVL